MEDFETSLNNILIDTFNFILKYEESSLRALTKEPVTVTEAHIIEVIDKLGERSTAGAIAAALGISPPTATVAIKKIEVKGFISKSPCPADKRRTIIILTEAGKRINKAHGIFHHKMVRNISAGFEDDEKQVLLSAVQKLNRFFKQKVEA